MFISQAFHFRHCQSKAIDTLTEQNNYSAKCESFLFPLAAHDLTLEVVERRLEHHEEGQEENKKRMPPKPLSFNSLTMKTKLKFLGFLWPQKLIRQWSHLVSVKQTVH